MLRDIKEVLVIIVSFCIRMAIFIGGLFALLIGPCSIIGPFGLLIYPWLLRWWCEVGRAYLFEF